MNQRNTAASVRARLLSRARDKGVFGTKMRSVIKAPGAGLQAHRRRRWASCCTTATMRSTSSQVL